MNTSSVVFLRVFEKMTTKRDRRKIRFGFYFIRQFIALRNDAYRLHRKSRRRSPTGTKKYINLLLNWPFYFAANLSPNFMMKKGHFCWKRKEWYLIEIQLRNFSLRLRKIINQRNANGERCTLCLRIWKVEETHKQLSTSQRRFCF